MPVIALSSDLLTYGPRYPENLNLMRQIVADVRTNNAVPAMVAVLGGNIKLGVTLGELDTLARQPARIPVCLGDLAGAVCGFQAACLDMACTLFAVRESGLKIVLASTWSGIDNQPSAQPGSDLVELSRSPLLAVCAGFNAKCDPAATLAFLSSSGVMVIRYQRKDMPLSPSRDGGGMPHLSASTPEEVIGLARTHWNLGFKSGVLVVVPPLPDDLPFGFSRIGSNLSIYSACVRLAAQLAKQL